MESNHNFRNSRFIIFVVVYILTMGQFFQDMNSSVSFSLINSTLIEQMVRWLNTYLSEWIGDYGMIKFDYGFWLLLFLILCIVNPVIQYFSRIPWLTFYISVFSVTTVLVVYFFVDENLRRGYDRLSDGNLCIGAILSIIIGVFMMIFSWASLSWNYKKYWIYWAIALIWCIFSCVLLEYVNETGVVFALFLFLGVIDIPFLLFAFPVSLYSWFVHSRK